MTFKKTKHKQTYTEGLYLLMKYRQEKIDVRFKIRNS